MALVRKSNTRRNVITISFLAAAIIGGGVLLYINSQPVDFSTGDDAGAGSFRDIDKIRQFNAIDFDRAGLFLRPDYQSLQAHGTPPDPDATVDTGVVNPFIPSQ